MDTGYISIHRKITENWLWSEKPFDKGRAWIDLLLMVNHEDAKIMFNGSITEVKRSQRITSVRYLSERWGWSSTKTKKFLDQLKSDGMIDYFSDTKKTVITIGNYDLYQYDKTKKVKQKNIKSKLKVKQKNTNNNDNNENNDNKKDIHANSHDDVEEIRKKYLGTKNKAVADKKLPKLIEQYGKEQLIRCIERYNQYVAAERENGFTSLKYKNESTFWNGGYIDYLDENIENTSSNTKVLHFDQYSDMYYYLEGDNRVYVDKEAQ